MVKEALERLIDILDEVIQVASKESRFIAFPFFECMCTLVESS